MPERLMLEEKVSLNSPNRAAVLATALEIRRLDGLPGCQSVGEFVQRMVSKKLDPVGIKVEVTEYRAERAGLPQGTYRIASLIEYIQDENYRSLTFGQWHKVILLEPVEGNETDRRFIDINSNSFSFFGL